MDLLSHEEIDRLLDAFASAAPVKEEIKATPIHSDEPSASLSSFSDPEYWKLVEECADRAAQN